MGLILELTTAPKQAPRHSITITAEPPELTYIDIDPFLESF